MADARGFAPTGIGGAETTIVSLLDAWFASRRVDCSAAFCLEFMRLTEEQYQRASAPLAGAKRKCASSQPSSAQRHTVHSWNSCKWQGLPSHFWKRSFFTPRRRRKEKSGGRPTKLKRRARGFMDWLVGGKWLGIFVVAPTSREP